MGEGDRFEIKMGEWGGDRVKSMANFHNVREVSLINAIGCEGFEKNTH